MDVIKALYPENAAVNIQAAKELVNVQAKIISACNDLEALSRGEGARLAEVIQPAASALESANEVIDKAIDAVIDSAMKGEEHGL